MFLQGQSQDELQDIISGCYENFLNIKGSGGYDPHFEKVGETNGC